MRELHASPPLGREDYGDVTVLRVHVPMLRSDGDTDALFEETYSLVRDAGRTRLVLNLDGVVFLASVALGKLVSLLRKVSSAGGRLAVCKVNRTIEEVLQLTHLSEILLIYGDEQEAVQSFA